MLKLCSDFLQFLFCRLINELNAFDLNSLTCLGSNVICILSSALEKVVFHLISHQ